MAQQPVARIRSPGLPSDSGLPALPSDGGLPSLPSDDVSGAASPSLVPAEGEMDLFEACRLGNIVQVKRQLSEENVNSRDSTGRKSTPLHFAAGFGRKDVVEYILEHGSKPDAQDDGGLIPLHNACSFGHTEVVQVLLQHGADPNTRDNWNYTPLHESAHKGKVAVCILLLQHGADPGIRNTDGKSPCDLADPVTKTVLTGDYKRDELLEAAKQGNDEKLLTLLTPLNVNSHAGDGRKSSPLHLAAGFNRVGIVKSLLKYGADVHAKDKGGLVPLHNACSYGHYEVVEMLLKYGAQVNAADLWQFTPMHEAASKGRREVCTLLLCHGADPYLPNCHSKTAFDLAPVDMQDTIDTEFRGMSLLTASGSADVTQIKKIIAVKPHIVTFVHPLTGNTVLHCAVVSEAPKRKSTVELLIKKGADVNAQNNDSLTPLHFAAEKAHMDMVEVLVKHGAKLDLADKDGMTVLHLSAKQGLHTVFRFLLSHGADMNLTTAQGETVEQLARPSVKKVLQEENAKFGPNLHCRILEAAKEGNLDVLRELVTPERVNCQDVEGRNSTPLHFAAGYNRKEIVDFLLEQGADVSKKDKGGLVPLHNACSYGHLQVTELLIQHGANVNESDFWGYTPLHEAAAKNKLEICRMLLDQGAQVDAKTREGQTPFDLLKDKDGDLADLLRGHRALLDAAKKGDLDRVKKLVNKQNVNCQDEQGRNSSPLHLAAGYNHLQVAEWLIQQGANVNAKDKGGLIPLHNASSYGHLDVAQLLINNHSEVNATDRWKFTPLHEAAQKGRTQLCSLLVMNGADVNLKNQDGHTALDIAAGEDVKSLLKAAMGRAGSSSIRVVPATSSEVIGGGVPQVVGGVLPSVNALLQQNPWSVMPQPQSVLESYDDGLEGVLRMLKELGLEDYCDRFRKEMITMDVLVDMGHEPLKEIGVDAYGARHKILKKVKETSLMAARAEGSWATAAMGPLPLPPDDGSVRLVQLAPADHRYKNVEDLMLRTIRSHQGNAGGLFTTYNIVKMEQVCNTRVYRRYMYQRGEISDTNGGDSNEMFLFHGSPFVKSIVESGFDERHSCSTGMFGAGIYFAEDSSKSNQYVFGISGRGCPLHSDKSCYTCERNLLLCRVILGKSHKQTSAQRHSHAPPGHHSVTGAPTDGGLVYTEYVIYRGEQAYPEYHITYRIVPPDGTE